MIDHVDSVAKNKMNIPGWEPYAWERIGNDGLLVTGGIPRLIKRGKRKGEKMWEGKGDKVVVVQSEVDKEKDRYERETGKCCNCMGDVEVFAGWSMDTGRRVKVCGYCNGSGVSQDKP
jgi:hypothetical protein